MKTLRVLTGLHAAASMTLQPGQYRLGRPADADGASREEDPAVPDSNHIALFDWNGAALLLSVSESGGTTYSPLHTRHDAEDPATAAGVSRWPDLAPLRFDQLVLCIGESDSRWPTDAELLARLDDGPPISPAFSGAAAKRGRPLPRALWLIVLMALTTLSAIFSSPSDLHATAPVAPGTSPRSADSLRKTLRENGLRELEVRDNGDRLVVTGLVANLAEDTTARQALGKARTPDAVPDWDVVSQVSDTIATGLKTPKAQLQVRYLGEGRFRVEGEAPNAQRLREAAKRMEADLGANVRALEVSVESHRKASVYTSIVSSGEIRYAERSDGAKSFEKITH